SCSVTVTWPTRCSRTGPTRPFFTPDTRTGSPSFRPLTFLKTTLVGTVLETSERPVSQNMKPVNTTNPTSTSSPTRTSCLYVMSIRPPSPHSAAHLPRHRPLMDALQELQHGRIQLPADAHVQPHRVGHRPAHLRPALVPAPP